MFDSVAAQYTLTGALLCADALNTVNVKNYRRMQLQKELDLSTIWTTARGGCSGAGILVEEPTARCKNPNLDGPVLDWVFPVLVVENPNVNFTNGVGTMLNDSMIAQLVMDALHKFFDEQFGTFVVDGEAMQPDQSYAAKGLLANRTNFVVVGRNTQTQRVGALTVAVAGGNATLSCAADPTAELRYTLDGSAPTRVAVDALTPGGQLYAGPFAVTSGDEIRAAGFKAGKNQSPARYFIVP